MEAPTVTDLRAVPAPAMAPAQPSAVAHQQCDECDSAVAAEQRYCVACGAHRRNVDDPAARYLSQASALTRRVTSITTVGDPVLRPRSRALGLGTALVLAAIPVAAGLGVVAGRSAGNGDASLVRALSHQSSADNALLQALSAAPAATASGSPPGATGHTKAATGKHHAKARSAAATSTSASSLSTSKPTPAQVQSGASVVKKIQKSSGKGYVNSQSGLPGTIVVP